MEGEDFVELTVTVRDSEGKKTIKTFDHYGPITLSRKDETIQKYIKELVDGIKETIDDIRIRGLMVIQ